MSKVYVLQKDIVSPCWNVKAGSEYVYNSLGYYECNGHYTTQDVIDKKDWFLPKKEEKPKELYKRGDVVIKNSGSMPMTVSHYDVDGKVNLVWFNSSNLKFGRFSQETIKLYEKEQPTDTFQWDEETAKEYGKFCVLKNSWLQFDDFKQSKSTPKVKPPLGITPEFIIKEQRLQDIRDAFNRYNNTNFTIPQEWFNEENGICKWLWEHYPTSPLLTEIDKVQFKKSTPKEERQWRVNAVNSNAIGELVVSFNIISGVPSEKYEAIKKAIEFVLNGKSVAHSYHITQEDIAIIKSENNLYTEQEMEEAFNAAREYEDGKWSNQFPPPRLGQGKHPTFQDYIKKQNDKNNNQ